MGPIVKNNNNSILKLYTLITLRLIRESLSNEKRIKRHCRRCYFIVLLSTSIICRSASQEKGFKGEVWYMWGSHLAHPFYSTLCFVVVKQNLFIYLMLLFLYLLHSFGPECWSRLFFSF